jgi:Prion-inhibition and propagation
MDPFTAAGLGLSVASLVLQLFAGCIKGYQIFIDAAGMPVNFEHLRVRMRIEQVRLLNWGEKVGILEEMLEQPSVTLQLHRNLVIDILLETQLLFKGCLKIEAIFDNLVPLKDVQSSNAIAQNSGHRLERCTNKSLTKTLKALEKTTEVPKGCNGPP